MDYVSPHDVAANMMNAALTKSALKRKDLLIRGMLSGALLAISVTLACLATTQTQLPLIGALVFPVGFVIIVLLGLELVTGSFALIPLAWLERKISTGKMLYNLSWVFAGNLIGSLLFAFLIWIASTDAGTLSASGAIEQAMVKIAEKKTIGYASHGFYGLLTAFVKGILCNWMVCMGVVMGMTSRSTPGKILAAGIPIFIFFALGYEHAVVNMFVIPAGILFGAKATIADWWLYNQIVVTAGNILGGMLFTGMAVYYTYTKKPARKSEQQAELTSEETELPAPGAIQTGMV